MFKFNTENSCKVSVFYICIFSDKLDLFEETCFILIIEQIALNKSSLLLKMQTEDAHNHYNYLQR